MSYDFDPKIEGTDALVRWSQAAHEAWNANTTSERLYGRELVLRIRQLADDMLSPTVEEMAAERSIERYQERRAYG